MSDQNPPHPGAYQWAPAPSAYRMPPWLAERSPLEALAIGMAAVGLFMAAVSYALPWEYHQARSQFGYSYYVGTTGSAGLQYSLGLLLMIGGVMVAQAAPYRFNVLARVFAGAVGLLQLGLLTGIVMLAKVAVPASAGESGRPTELGWGLIFAYVAVMALGAAIALSHRPAPVAPAPSAPAPPG